MSETVTHDLNGAMHNVRRAASHSVTLLKAATGLSDGRAKVALLAANDSIAEPSPLRAPPSIISAHTEMTGSITTTDELHVHGKIKGDVRAAAITVCAGGAVHGDLIAETILIDGAVEGRMEAQHVLLRAGAVVTGEIVHGSLGVDTAAVFEGTIKRAATSATAAE
jgi:cytoskeletal protein CcmA (bactofilin family)